MTVHVKPLVQLVTAPTPGAVAIIQLRGADTQRILTTLTGRDDWPLGRMRFAPFADIDEGVVVLLRGDWAQLMPHGGPRVVQRLLDHLIALGCAYDAAPSPRDTYPEAAGDIEADMLDALARAASPLAVDWLLAQPRLWRELVEADDAEARCARALADADDMQRLIEPASVVVVGQPNVGKSTLTNRMLGRAASIVADLPGTTRDWVAALAELGDGQRGVCVRWMDTPGLRASDDAIEQSAIGLARQVIDAADVLIAMRDPTIDWPDTHALPRAPDVYVMNKIDDAPDDAAASPGAGTSRDTPLPISAEHDRGTAALARHVLAALRLDPAAPPRLWAFGSPLRDILTRGDRDALKRYVTTTTDGR